MCETRGEVFIIEVVCDRSSIMAGKEPSSPSVRVFMTEEEALWNEFEHVDSQQGSSYEENLWVDVSSVRALSQAGAGPSGHVAKMVDSEEIEVVYSEEPVHVVAEISLGNERVEPDVESQPGEGVLLNNPKSSISTVEVKLWRYLSKIPLSVEIRVPTPHERVDWVVPG